MRYVLAGFSGSERSRVAVLRAQKIAASFGARLHVLMVTRLPSGGIDVPVDDDIIEDIISHATRQLGILRSQLDQGGFPQFAVRLGEPAQEIARYALEYGVRDVFLGQTRQMVPRVMSTGWRVGRLVARADCRVMIVAAQTLCAELNRSACPSGVNDSRMP